MSNIIYTLYLPHILPLLVNLPKMSSYGSTKIASSRPPLQPVDTQSRRQSTTSNASPTSSLTNPRVQLVPHARTVSYDGSLSPSDIELLANTSFDAKDMSSRDFDFDDVFTYDKPQRKLKSVVEVSSTRDWSQFTFPNYSSAASTKQKHSRGRTTAGEMYVKNQGDARKR